MPIPLVKPKFIYLILSFTLVLPVSAVARESLFDTSGTSLAHIKKSSVTADNIKSARKTITLNKQLLSSKTGDELDFISMAGRSWTSVQGNNHTQ